MNDPVHRRLAQREPAAGQFVPDQDPIRGHHPCRVSAASLEPSLTELVTLYASKINGRATGINIHTIEARANGETGQRIYLLSA